MQDPTLTKTPIIRHSRYCIARRLAEAFCSVGRLGIAALAAVSALGPAAATAQVPAPPLEKGVPQQLQELSVTHPLCVGIGESFLNQWATQDIREEGPFRDKILGACVEGQQLTQGHSYIDCLPNASHAQSLFVLDGVTQHLTASKTPQAVIHSQGNFRFVLTKQVDFDGQTFQTRSPYAALNINMRHLGAETRVSNVPVLGPVANRIALSAAEQSRPVADQITADRITSQIAPRFNDEIDTQLAAWNRALTEQVRPFLEDRHLLPRQIVTRSTSQAIVLGASLEAPANPLAVPIQTGGYWPQRRTRRFFPAAAPSGGPVLPAPHVPSTQSPNTHSVAKPLAAISLPAMFPSDQSWLLLHESLIKHSLRELPLQNLEIPDSALQNVWPPNLEGILNAKPQMATLVLTGPEPIQLAFEQDVMVLTVHVVIRPVLGMEIPPLAIVIALKPELQPEKIELSGKIRDIHSLSSDPEAQLSSVAENLIRQTVEQFLQPQTFPREWKLPPTEQQPKEITLRLERLHLADGWCDVALSAARPPLPLQAASPSP